MLFNSCSHDTAHLAALRDRAWAKSRTDIVLDLDLHDSLWAFQQRPDWVNLVKLAALLPAGDVDESLTGRISRLATAGPAGYDLSELREPLYPWCRHLCRRITADLEDISLRPDTADLPDSAERSHPPA